MKIFMFGASLRKDSYNKKLIALAAKVATELEHDVDLAQFNDFELPLYNGDIQHNQGIPAKANEFSQRMQQANATLISVPEYNFSMPGTLKNLIDWVSRINPMPFTNQRIMLLSASPSLVGGNRSLWNTRVPLECCNAIVFPDMFSLASAHEAFDETGKLKNTQLQQRLTDSIKNFLSFVKKLI